MCLRRAAGRANAQARGGGGLPHACRRARRGTASPGAASSGYRQPAAQGLSRGAARTGYRRRGWAAAGCARIPPPVRPCGSAAPPAAQGGSASDGAVRRLGCPDSSASSPTVTTAARPSAPQRACWRSMSVTPLARSSRVESTCSERRGRRGALVRELWGASGAPPRSVLSAPPPAAAPAGRRWPATPGRRATRAPRCSARPSDGSSGSAPGLSSSLPSPAVARRSSGAARAAARGCRAPQKRCSAGRQQGAGDQQVWGGQRPRQAQAPRGDGLAGDAGGSAPGAEWNESSGRRIPRGCAPPRTERKLSWS